MLHKAKVDICPEINKKYLNTVRAECTIQFQNCGKRLLASSWLFVCPSAHMEQLCSKWTDFHES
jgi:hypothetical protein